jgi:hypothetical protein|tara:strand:+ start:467 stop:676 length:210 start_codon:yes stop_codon:yes gene_type:complete
MTEKKRNQVLEPRLGDVDEDGWETVYTSEEGWATTYKDPRLYDWLHNKRLLRKDEELGGFKRPPHPTTQ